MLHEANGFTAADSDRIQAAAVDDDAHTIIINMPVIRRHNGCGIRTPSGRCRRFGLLAGISAALMLPGLPATALGPHEVLVLANAREPDSIAIARSYMRQRRIPEVNLLNVDPGGGVTANGTVISPEAFTARIWGPAQTALKERGIGGHILAWVYSTHFPFRIATQPPLSLQGITFLRNRLPPASQVADGTYHSPLFAGPESPTAPGFGPESLDTSARFLGDDLPLPSMTLGYTGPGGNTLGEIRAMLVRGSNADRTRPDGAVYFVTRDDIRSRIREWQFPSAALGLRRMGIEAIVTNAMPERADGIIGLMTGASTVHPERVGRFLPGAMAEHLTSLAGTFDLPDQTKLSRWIAAGATASAGTVCEPLSYWSKFPHARFFNHYRMGCTLMESFYLSVRSPLQLIMIGEPLATPWAPAATLSIEGIRDGERVTAPRPIDLHIETRDGTVFTRFIYLVDGRIRGEGRTFTLNPDGLSSGAHEFRAVAYGVGFVRGQIFDTLSFRIP